MKGLNHGKSVNQTKLSIITFQTQLLYVRRAEIHTGVRNMEQSKTAHGPVGSTFRHQITYNICCAFTFDFK